MDVLIIGGTRFVGYQLTWRLLAGAHRITLLNRGMTPDPFGSRVERLVADRQTPAFARVLAGRSFDAAVDFCCYTGADAAGAIAALGNGQVGHYLLISTGQVYLVRDGAPRPARETDYDGPLITGPDDPADGEDYVYGIEKRRAEDALIAAGRDAGFPATRLRIPMVNGERDFFRRVESYLVRLLDGGPVILPDGGLHLTRHVYSGAVVRLIATILGDDQTFGQAYNLAQTETPSLAELVTLLADLLGARSRLVAVPSADLKAAGIDPAAMSPFSHHWMSFLDPTRARAELGFIHEAPGVYLDKIITSYLDHPPGSPPANYATRADEIRLADAV